MAWILTEDTEKEKGVTAAQFPAEHMWTWVPTVAVPQRGASHLHRMFNYVFESGGRRPRVMMVEYMPTTTTLIDDSVFLLIEHGEGPWDNVSRTSFGLFCNITPSPLFEGLVVLSLECLPYLLPEKRGYFTHLAGMNLSHRSFPGCIPSCRHSECISFCSLLILSKVVVPCTTVFSEPLWKVRFICSGHEMKPPYGVKPLLPLA